MSRGLSTINETQVDSSHVHDVPLVKLEFDTPVYVHSGIGTITYDTNDYLGVVISDRYLKHASQKCSALRLYHYP